MTVLMNILSYLPYHNRKLNIVLLHSLHTVNDEARPPDLVRTCSDPCFKEEGLHQGCRQAFTEEGSQAST
jgi:hypothetical protein